MFSRHRDDEPATPEILAQLRDELQRALVQTEARPSRRYVRAQQELLAQIDRVSAELAAIALRDEPDSGQPS